LALITGVQAALGQDLDSDDAGGANDGSEDVSSEAHNSENDVAEALDENSSDEEEQEEEEQEEEDPVPIPSRRDKPATKPTKRKRSGPESVFAPAEDYLDVAVPSSTRRAKAPRQARTRPH